MRSSAKFLSLFLLSVLVLPGCYTQLKVSESDNKYSEREYYSEAEYESDYRSYSADDTTYVSGYRDGVLDANRYFKNYDVYHRWNRYNNISFNHYYPYSHYDYPYHRSYLSVTFGHGWGYYSGFGYGYGDPFFYDPFYASYSHFHGYRGYYGSGFYNHGFPNYYAYYHNDFKPKRDDTKYQYGPRNSGSLSVDGRDSRISNNGPSVSSAYLKSLAPTSGSSGQYGNVRSEYLRPSRTGNSSRGALPSIGNFVKSIFESSGYTRSRTLNVDSPRTRGSRTGSSTTSVRKSRSGSGSSSSVRSSSSGSSKSSGSSSSGKRPSRVDR